MLVTYDDLWLKLNGKLIHPHKIKKNSHRKNCNSNKTIPNIRKFISILCIRSEIKRVKWSYCSSYSYIFRDIIFMSKEIRNFAIYSPYPTRSEVSESKTFGFRNFRVRDRRKKIFSIFIGMGTGRGLQDGLQPDFIPIFNYL